MVKVGEEYIAALLKSDKPDNLTIVQDDWFFGEEKAAIKFIREYYGGEGKLPKAELITSRFFPLTEPSASCRFFAKELKNRYMYTKSGELLTGSISQLKKDPQGTISKILSELSAISANVYHNQDEHYASDIVDRFDNYEELEGTKGITYISTGDDALDTLMMGYRRDDLITIGGRSGSGKTFLLLYLLNKCAISLPEDYGDILCITNEMDIASLKIRMDAIKFKLNYDALLKGELTPDAKERYKKGLMRPASKKLRVKFVYNITNFEELAYKIQLYKPPAVFIDGSYLFEPAMEEGIAKTTYITRQLKAITSTHNIPVINTMQLRKKTGRKKLSLSFDAQDEFFYGSVVQDSTFAIRLFIDKDMAYHCQVGMDFAKGRFIKPNTQAIFEMNVLTGKYKLEIPADSSTTDMEEETVF